MSDQAGTPQLCEESIRLIFAASEDEAWNKATSVGKMGEHEYVNPYGNAVVWRFVKILEIQDLCEATVTDGMEVFSRMYRCSESGGLGGKPLE